MKIIELFGGIGACSTALKRLGIDIEVVDYVEIDKYACASYNAINGTNFETQDICTWDKDLKDIDLIMHGSPCFVAGTKVITNKGYKNIENVQVGDFVLTHKNRYKEVTKIGHNLEQKVFMIKAQGMFATNVTGNHPYYIRTMYKKWNGSTRKYERKWTEPSWKEAKELKKNDFIGIPIPTISDNPSNLDKETCWLLGRYVADGHIRHSKRKGRKNSCQYGVVYSIGKSKLKEFKKHLVNRYATVYPHTKSVYRAIINSKEMVELIEKYNFGKGAANKKVPKMILNLPVDLATAFLDGYMSGDGTYTENSYKATSISKELILGLQLLIAKVYRTSSNVSYTLRPNKTLIEGRIVNQNDSYSIVFNKEIKKQNKTFVDLENNIIWYPVKGVQEESKKRTVYNLSVKDDNSYTANNFIVHNCQDFSLAGKQAGGDIGSGTRSSLMYETVRIVGKIRPKYVIWENVKNVLSAKHRHNFDNYLNAMQSLGYTNYYEVLNAKDYGIPQNRERVFVVSILGNKKYEFPKGTECNNRIEVVGNYMPSGHNASRIVDENGLAPTVKENHGTVTAVLQRFEFPPKQELKLRLKDMLEDEVDEKYYLSDEQVNKIETSTFMTNQRRIQEKEWCDTLCARDWKDPKCVRVGILDIKGHDCIKRVYSDDGISPTLTDMQGGNRQPKIIIDDTQGFDGTRLYDNYSPTIRAARSGLKTIDNYRIRKLTPRETWRLMRIC